MQKPTDTSEQLSVCLQPRKLTISWAALNAAWLSRQAGPNAFFPYSSKSLATVDFPSRVGLFSVPVQQGGLGILQPQNSRSLLRASLHSQGSQHEPCGQPENFISVDAGAQEQRDDTGCSTVWVLVLSCRRPLITKKGWPPWLEHLC